MNVMLVDSDGLSICRVCLQSIPQNSKTFNLFNTTKESLLLKIQLESLAPEMDLNLISDAIICINCRSALHISYTFQKKCHDSDHIIKSSVYKLKQAWSAQSIKENMQINSLHQKPVPQDEVVTMEEPFIDIPHLISCTVSLEYLPDYVNVTQKALVQKKNNNSDDYNILPFSKLKKLQTKIVRKRHKITMVKRHKANVENNVENCQTKKINMNMPCFKCNICSYTSHMWRNYQSHLAIHESPTHSRCTQCDFIALSQRKVDHHMKQHKLNKISKSNMSTSKSIQKTNKGNNIKNYQTKGTDINKAYFKCNMCSYSNKNWRVYKCHLIAHNSYIQFQCTICNFIAIQKHGFEDHMKRHKLNKISKSKPPTFRRIQKETTTTYTQKNQLVACRLCPFKAKSEQGLKNHTRIHR